MRRGFLGSITAILIWTGFAAGQMPSQNPNAGSAMVEGDILPTNGGSPATVIPPPIPLAPAAMMDGSMGTGPVYPPPANFQGLEASNLPQVPTGPTGSEAPLFWMSGDYLLFFAKSQPNHYPLVTTSNIASAGVLNQPTTATLFGQNNTPYNIMSGFRVNGGFYFDDSRRVGLDFGGFWLEKRSRESIFQSDQTGNPVLARPFLDASTLNQNAIVVTSPGFAGGGIVIDTTTQTWTTDANMTFNMYRSCPTDTCVYSLDFLAGIRYAQLEESLQITSVSNLLMGVNPPSAFGTNPLVSPLDLGTNFTTTIVDSFHTMNQFYGGQLGLKTNVRYGRWGFDGSFKLGVGDMHSLVNINGATLLTRGIITPTTGSVYGGVLANAQNIGSERRDHFALLPEIGLNLAYNITQRIQFRLGYTFLYMNNVVRPGDLVQPIVQSGLIPSSSTFGQVGGVLPRFNNFPSSDFFVQGVSMGISVKY